eukprot:scaffold15231_cov66-Cyclotella_meneghiniana.AAC.18
MNHAIKLFSEGKDYNLLIEIYLRNNQHNIVEAEIIITDKFDHLRRHNFTHELRNRDQWDKFGKTIGHSSSIYRLFLGKQEIRETDTLNDISEEEYECLELLYRGLESNSSIEVLELDMDLFPEDEVLPTFNLANATSNEKMKHLILDGDYYTTDNHSFMISSVLETKSWETFSITSRSSSTSSSESAFRRIVMACTNVKVLDVDCRNISSRFTALADLLRNPASNLREIIISKDIWPFRDDENKLSTILAGLSGNETLKKLKLWRPIVHANSLIIKLLCDTTSIEHIYNSNHTLEEFSPIKGRMQTLRMAEMRKNHVLKKLLELNRNTNKEEVIRTKIVRYYFVGNFDLSPFVNMNISLLSNVLAVIECHSTIFRLSAIFRLLRSIPDLCNVNSREVIGQVTGSKDIDKSCNKRQKIDQ